MLCGSTTGGIPGSTSIVGAGDVEGATGVGGVKLATPDASADIAAIADEFIASSAVDAPESAGALAPTALPTDPELAVPTVPTAEVSEWEHPASRKPDTNSTDTGRRRLIDLLCQSRPRPPAPTGRAKVPDPKIAGPIHPDATPWMDDTRHRLRRVVVLVHDPLARQQLLVHPRRPRLRRLPGGRQRRGHHR